MKIKCEDGREAEFVRATPEYAGEKLGDPEMVNRKRHEDRVKGLARDMLDGNYYDWHVLCFDRKGHLLDGQYTLAAVLLSGVSRWFLVQYGVDPKAQLYMDERRGARSLREQLGLMGETAKAAVAGLAASLMDLDTGFKGRNGDKRAAHKVPTIRDRWDYLVKYESALTSSHTWRMPQKEGRFLARAPVLATFVYASTHYPSKVQALWEDFVAGKATGPLDDLHQRLYAADKNRANGGSHRRVAICMTAFYLARALGAEFTKVHKRQVRTVTRFYDGDEAGVAWLRANREETH